MTVSPAAPAPVDNFVQQLHAALREAFGDVPFHVWSAGVSTPCLLPGPSDDDHLYEAHGGLFRSPRFAELLNATLAAREPCIAAEQEAHLLLIPVPRTEAGAVVAVGEFNQGSDEWLLRLARLFASNFDHCRHRQTAQQELAAYARQVTEDFEELAFLRSLAECLEIGDTLVSRWQTAQSVLPFLRLAVKAEAVFLIAADHRGLNDDQGPEVGEIVSWAGKHVIDDKAARRLVCEWRGSATDQPVVKNRLDQPDAQPSLPGLHEMIIAPISRHGDLYGWVTALNRSLPPPPADGEIPFWGLSDMEFGSNEATLLVSASAVFAACARNVDLIRQKENLLVGVVRALVSAIEARDPYTFGHSERVGLTAQRLGEQLGLGRQHCRRLYLTGLLHDIGKIGISDQILRKPGQLSHSELEQVKKHTRLGYSILQDLDQLAFVLPGVLHHHERYDGKGYPDGFSGDEIPLDARVIAVADAYDAMVSDRPYRQGMTDNQAETCLRAGAGLQWDANVVEAFFKAREEIRTISRAYQPPPEELRSDAGADPMTAARACVASTDLSDVVLSTLPPP